MFNEHILLFNQITDSGIVIVYDARQSTAMKLTKKKNREKNAAWDFLVKQTLTHFVSINDLTLG